MAALEQSGLVSVTVRFHAYIIHDETNQGKTYEY